MKTRTWPYRLLVCLVFALLSTPVFAVDTDGDGLDDVVDNCPLDYNPMQLDSDCDGIGDFCDFEFIDMCHVANDDDMDGILNGNDNCPAIPNPGQQDVDCDGIGDACDPDNSDGVCDTDGDGIGDNLDNCPVDPNPTQTDTDCDGFGDACDPNNSDGFCDVDADGIEDALDNCPVDYNPDQADSDCDGAGDVCDTDGDSNQCPVPDSDNDGIPDDVDRCPAEDSTGRDIDRDGCIDAVPDITLFIENSVSDPEVQADLVPFSERAVMLLNQANAAAVRAQLRALLNKAEQALRRGRITQEEFDLINGFVSGSIDEI